MPQEILREDLDNLQIDKKRMEEMSQDELRGVIFDTRNGLKSRKATAVSRSGLSQSWADVTRS